MSPSSNHTGGVNVAFVDGSVHFVSEVVDAGLVYVDTHDLWKLSGPSSFGVWGALGSIDGGETARLP